MEMEKQQLNKEKIFAYLCDYKSLNDGLSPHRDKIMQDLGIISEANIDHLLQSLERDGRIKVTEAGIHVVGGIWFPPVGW